MTFADGNMLFEQIKSLLQSELQQRLPPLAVSPTPTPHTEVVMKPKPMLSLKELQALPKYSGNNQDLKIWDSQLRDMLKLAGHVPVAAMATIVLSGEAQTWWQQLKTSEEREGRSVNDLPWTELIEKLRARFVLVTSKENARQLYRKLINENGEKGVKPADLVKFQQRFLQLLNIIEDVSDAQAKADFIYCMPKYLKGHLSTLEPTMTVTQVVESCLRYNSQTATPGVVPLPGERKEDKRDMMQIDALVRERSKPKPYPGVSDEEHQRRLEKQLCLCCGKDDHWASGCPDKPAVEQSGNARGRGRGRGGRGRGRGRW